MANGPWTWQHVAANWLSGRMPTCWIPSPPPVPKWEISTRLLNGRIRQTDYSSMLTTGRKARIGSICTSIENRTGRRTSKTWS